LPFTFFAIAITVLSDYFNVFPVAETFGYGVVQRGIKANFVDVAKTSSTHAEADPAILLYIVEFLVEQVYVKSTLRAAL